MILDSLTIAALASELARQHVGQYIRRARADETGLDVLFGANPTEASTVLQLRFGPPASLSLAPAEGLTGTGREGHDNRERYLEDSRIDGVTAALAAEVAKDGLLVNTLEPGFIRTEALDAIDDLDIPALEASIPIGRMGRPDEIAAFAAWLVGPENTYISGASLIIDGGLVRV